MCAPCCTAKRNACGCRFLCLGRPLVHPVAHSGPCRVLAPACYCCRCLQAAMTDPAMLLLGPGTHYASTLLLRRRMVIIGMGAPGEVKVVTKQR